MWVHERPTIASPGANRWWRLWHSCQSLGMLLGHHGAVEMAVLLHTFMRICCPSISNAEIDLGDENHEVIPGAQQAEPKLLDMQQPTICIWDYITAKTWGITWKMLQQPCHSCAKAEQTCWNEHTCYTLLCDTIDLSVDLFFSIMITGACMYNIVHLIYFSFIWSLQFHAILILSSFFQQAFLLIGKY